jgi:hypothetical protein
LGIAGWWFQVTTQRANREREARERSSRQCLPIVRALTELELALDDVSNALSRHPLVIGDITRDCGVRVNATSDDQSWPQNAVLLNELASRVESAAISTGMMKGDIATLDLPDIDRILPITRRYSLGVRATSFMFADLLRVVAVAGDPSLGKQTLRRLGWHTGTKWVYVEVDGTSQTVVPIREEGIPVWLAWLGEYTKQRVPLPCVADSLPQVALALRRQVAALNLSVMRDYPEFGEQFVSIRSDAIKTRAPLPRFESRAEP